MASVTEAIPNSNESGDGLERDPDKEPTVRGLHFRSGRSHQTARYGAENLGLVRWTSPKLSRIRVEFDHLWANNPQIGTTSVQICQCGQETGRSGLVSTGSSPAEFDQNRPTLVEHGRLVRCRPQKWWNSVKLGKIHPGCQIYQKEPGNATSGLLSNVTGQPSLPPRTPAAPSGALHTRPDPTPRRFLMPTKFRARFVRVAGAPRRENEIGPRRKPPACLRCQIWAGRVLRHGPDLWVVSRAG